MNNMKSYRYKLKTIYILPVILIIIFFFYLAANNDKGLIIQGLIRLNQNQATTFYLGWGCILTIICVWIIVNSAIVSKSIRIYSKQIEIPNPIAGKTNSILFDDIVYVTDQEIKHQRIATIHTKYKEEYSILMNCLDSMKDYMEILSILNDRISSSVQIIRNAGGNRHQM